MPKFIISLTRDTSENGYVAIESEDEDAAKREYLAGEYTDDVVWSEGDWVGDSEVLEVLPYEGNEGLLDPPGPKHACAVTRLLGGLTEVFGSAFPNREAAEVAIEIDMGRQPGLHS